MNRHSIGGGKLRDAYITFRTTPEVKAKIRQIAEKHNEGMSAFVERILLKYVKKVS